MPCRNCYIFGNWRSKEVGKVDVLNLSYGGQATMRGPIFIWRLTPLDTMVCKNKANTGREVLNYMHL